MRQSPALRLRSPSVWPLALAGALTALIFCSPASAQDDGTTRGADLTTGLLAHYPLDGDALDTSGQNRHGTLSTIPAPLFAAGALGQALDLRGIDAWVDLPVVLNSVSNCSIAAFFQVDSYDGSNSTFGINVLFSEVLPASPMNEVALALDENPILRVFLYPVTGFADFLAPPTSWQHVLFTFEGSTNTVTAYQNGVFSGSTQILDQPSSLCGTASAATLGALDFNGNMEGFFDGRIDEVRIYDRLLGAPEAVALWAEYANLFLDGFETGNTNAWSP